MSKLCPVVFAVLAAAALLHFEPVGARAPDGPGLEYMYEPCTAAESPFQWAHNLDSSVPEGQQEVYLSGRARLTMEVGKDGRCRVLDEGNEPPAQSLYAHLVAHCSLVGKSGHENREREEADEINLVGKTRKFLVQFRANLVPYQLRVGRKGLFGELNLFQRACLRYHLPTVGAATIVTLKWPVKPGRYHLQFGYRGVEAQDKPAKQ